MQKNKEHDGFSKTVEFKATDAEEQIASGIVMVPSKVDLHGDYVTEDTIREFAEQFGNFVGVGEAGGGVMHAVWPDEHISLDENTVVESETTIGSDTAPEGGWVQSWKFHDDELWSLVSDGVFTGYSIGAVDVKWQGPMTQDELPDGVDVADDYPDDELMWELVSGIMREVSTVDIPAVPDAQILETKSEAEKRLADHLGNREGFIDEATQRGHSEADAERLWDYLNRAIDIEGASDPATKEVGRFHRAGRAFLDAFTPGSGGEDGTTADKDTAKESRTLSAANRERLMAAHDAVEDALSSDMQFVGNRFTDNPAVDFDVADYPTAESAASTAQDRDEPGGTEPGRDADADADTDTKNKTMSDDDKFADAPEWAMAVHDDVSENSKAIDDLRDELESVKEDGEPEEPEDPEKAFEDAPAWAKQLREETDGVKEDMQNLAEATGKSQQLSGEVENEGDTESGDESMNDLAKLLG